MLFENLIKKIYRNNLFIRNDNADGIYYFSASDFPGLQAHAYSFRAGAGHELKGFFYCYEDPIPGRLVIFDHGMGNGHRAYLREIETLCRGGFLVFSYDHTGCMTSGGPDTGGFAQSLHDLDDCVRALRVESALANRSFSVMGHSWGGFSAMNICALHPEITHVVAMSGFVSVKRILKQTFSGLLKGYIPALYALERQTNPGYADYDARESLSATDAKVLLISSADDKVVNPAMHFEALKQALSGRENIRFRLEQGKGHNPSYTADAVAYKDTFFAQMTRAKKKKQLISPLQQAEFMARYDWLRMTQQDEELWALILSHLKGA